MLTNTHWNDRVTWAAGLFRHNTDSFGTSLDDDSGWNATARITALPYYEDDGRRLLHVGLGYSHQNPDRTFRYRARPESGAAVRYLDTRHPLSGRDFRADQVDLWAAELAGQYGPFSFQSEYLRSDVDTVDAGHRSFDGYYLQAGYMLTGEHRSYSLKDGVFGGVKPRRPFSLDGGLGAWELALRLSELDLDDGPVYGGQERNWTIGLNWYLNPVARVMLNYVRADINHALYGGDIDIFQSRFQFQF